MSFHYSDHCLQVEGLSILDLVTQYKSPCYIYSQAILQQQWQAFSDPLKTIPHDVCYAVKANANLTILATLAKWGAGFDIVSGGELAKVLKAGADPRKIVFSGVGKSREEIQAALQANIACFNVESREELLRIKTLAAAFNKTAAIALRINPDINVHTHPYITTGLKEKKFGMSKKQAMVLYQEAKHSKHLQIQGVACHIGSQLTTLAPFLQAMDHLLKISEQLANEGIKLSTINCGGGLGIPYDQEVVPTPQEYCSAILSKRLEKNSSLRLIIEPGRALVAKAGILITRIEYIKRNGKKNFAIVDAGMTELLRPALYQAQHNIQPVVYSPTLPEKSYDVVGPVCESSDFLAKNRKLRIQSGDYLAISDCGAYGFSMSSNYNMRPKVAEILVDKDNATLIRSRETLPQLWENEVVLNA